MPSRYGVELSLERKEILLLVKSKMILRENAHTLGTAPASYDRTTAFLAAPDPSVTFAFAGASRGCLSLEARGQYSM